MITIVESIATKTAKAFGRIGGVLWYLVYLTDAEYKDLMQNKSAVDWLHILGKRVGSSTVPELFIIHTPDPGYFGWTYEQ